jgi:hypothetical protein
MAMSAPLLELFDQRKRWPAESCAAAVRREEANYGRGGIT